ncbi:hypothetical protein HC752_23600 [Vibrio sp. S9_S30]|uniref:hypothetical protein n=1 Tax=Vibrio sp. S9_S30 TaxID=2720226 RepID=UPI0016815AED|nr:hypothetical protein [Vibrio sp. S9_S30]MBD1559913.1 hypothetical protein [Vibrio sp. S9_S30]
MFERNVKYLRILTILILFSLFTAIVGNDILPLLEPRSDSQSTILYIIIHSFSAFTILPSVLSLSFDVGKIWGAAAGWLFLFSSSFVSQYFYAATHLVAISLVFYFYWQVRENEKNT